MQSQSDLWLYPLAFVAAVSFVLCARLPLKWAWTSCLQSLIMFMTALFGILTSHKGGALIAGWCMFLLWFLIPRLLLTRLQRSLNLLNTEAAIENARQLRWFLWGLAGKFWLDLTCATAEFVRQNPDKAEAILAQWQESSLPHGAHDSIESTRLTGMMIRREWPLIAGHFEACLPAYKSRVPASTALLGARAYAELGRLDDTLRLVEIADLPSSRFNTEGIDMSLVPIAALTGDTELLEKISYGANKKTILPRCAQLYWLGRCESTRGQFDKARETLLKALSEVPANLSIWSDRIQYQIDRLEHGEIPVPAEAERQRASTRLNELYQRSTLVADIIAPGRQAPAVSTIVMLLVAAYCVSHSFQIWPSATSQWLSAACYDLGMLQKFDVLVDEQYWRLITYLFLHAHISHLSLNAFGLWWFGKITQKMFGTLGFLLIFFACGAAGGMWNIWLSTDPVIGASAAVLGIFGATTSGIFRMKDVLPQAIRNAELRWMLALAITQVILDQIVPRVAYYAHLGGLTSGLLLGLVLPLRKLSRQSAVRTSPEATYR